jgi:hypothetical protein
LFGAHVVREEGLQNEMRLFWQARGLLQVDFEMGSCNSRARNGTIEIHRLCPLFKTTCEAYFSLALDPRKLIE